MEININNFEVLEEEYEVRMDSQEIEDSNLNLDTSVLIDRKNIVKHAAIMDRYGIRIFEKEVELQIKEYQLGEQQKSVFYKAMVFHTTVNPEDKEMSRIREDVFTVSYTPSREIDRGNHTNDFWQSTVIMVIMAMVILTIGICYGKFKRKEREKKLADINDSYDE